MLRNMAGIGKDRLMFLQAQRFRSAGILLSSGKWEVVRNHVFPAMFNSYVAAEIYLKLLNFKHSGMMISGHNLKFLFENLPPPHRAKIRKLWKARPLMEIEKNPPLPIPDTLEEILAAAAHGYEEFRYLWESDGQGVFVIGPLPDILHRVTLELYPDLAKPIAPTAGG